MAASNDRTLHPSAHWEQIRNPLPSTPHRHQPSVRGYPGEPHIGALTEQALSTLWDLL